MRTMIFLAVSLLLTSQASAGDETPAGKQYQALLDEYEQEGGARIFAGRFLEFAEQNAGDSAAVDALLWVVKNVPGKPDTTRALEMLAKDHIQSDKLAPACRTIANSRCVAAEKLLRALVDKSPDKQIRAQACYYLDSLLSVEANLLAQLRAEPDLAGRILQYYGKEYGEHLSTLDAAQLTNEREQVLERLLKSFADVEMDDGTMGEHAEKALFAIRHLSVGRVAPEINGEDIFGKPFKLSDYRGKVVMLTFWGHW